MREGVTGNVREGVGATKDTHVREGMRAREGVKGREGVRVRKDMNHATVSWR